MTAVTARGEAFPPRPVRGVRARYVLQGGCGPFADAVVDFEPWEEGVHLEVAAGATVYGGAASQEDLARYHAALAEGARAELAEQLHDELFELRCAAEDVQTAARDREDYHSIEELAEELVDIARRIEQIRGQR